VSPDGIVGRAVLSIAIAGIVAAIDPSTVFADQLRDSTTVLVRMQGGINTETARVNQPITFVVTTDVVVGDTVVIKKDTLVMGVVVRARRMRWGFVQRRPRLAFRFSYTTTTDGRVVRLRTSPFLPAGTDLVVTNRGRSGHAMLWVGGTDVFAAYVDGNYEI